MTTQHPNDIQPPDARPKTPGEVAAESLMRPIFPAPAAPKADAAGTDTDRARSWFSLATEFTVIALAAGAAAAVAATYGPVFTLPMIGP